LPSSEAGRGSGRSRDSRDVCVGVVPRGTANALSSVLHIPAALEDAAALVNRAEARPFDVAVVDGEKAMLLQCGIGLEAEAVVRADRRLKNMFGPIAYQIAGILPLYRQKHFKVDVTLYGVRDTTLFAGGARVESDVLHIRGMKVKAVTIANAAPPTCVLAHGIGEVCCDDGLLEFVVVSSHGIFSLFGAMLDQFRSALLVKRTARNDIFGLRARRIEVTCDPPQRVVVDGDEVGCTPVTIELDPDPSKRQIKVIAPKASVVHRRKKRLIRTLVRTWRSVRGIIIFGVVVQCVRRFRAGHSGCNDNEHLTAFK
jgi:diacylglycerol kinase (ATP)